jgi:hypothetical protein
MGFVINWKSYFFSMENSHPPKKLNFLDSRSILNGSWPCKQESLPGGPWGESCLSNEQGVVVMALTP